MFLREMMASSYMGNTIGMISLVVGVISLIWTYKTYRKTKEIESKLPEEKAKAIDLKLFKDYRAKALSTLHTFQNAARKAGGISKQRCNDLITIINRIRGYNEFFSPEDMESLNAEYEKLIKMIKEDNDLKGNNGYIEYIEISSKLINILEKGKYEI